MDNRTMMVRANNWARIIEECNNSGKTVAEFCKEHNIAKSTYYLWQQRIRGMILDNLKEIEQPSSFYEDESTLRSDLTWPSIYIGDVNASKNDKEVSAVVYIVNNPGIAGALLRFHYDDALTLINAEPGKAFSSLEYTPPGQYANPCNFSWDSENGMTEENGAILVLTFKLPDDAQSGKRYEIRCSFRDSDIYDENLNDVAIGTEIGTITIQ